MDLSNKSWLKIWFNKFSISNYHSNKCLSKSNYLYVSSPPQVNNPLIIDNLDKVMGIPTYVFLLGVNYANLSITSLFFI